MNSLGVGIATVGGVGWFPVAPGTVGSAVGVGIYFLTYRLSIPAQAVLLLAITIVGIWAAGLAEKELKQEDPGAVVIDEVAGQLLTLFLTGVGWKGAITGFFLFRLLDITKPAPARQLEALHGGFGIMADDLMAGTYGLGLMILLVQIWPGIW
ncbi:MAG TPA: phosphatidylglycerophosphatase A [Vicinamibacterales bacterium]|nr:phosphatidylglycerophosphatase A [Vicinamibacterales bacterium]